MTEPKTSSRKKDQPPQAAAAAPTAHEYCMVEVDLRVSARPTGSPGEAMVAEANRLAAEGWRLITVIDDTFRGKLCGYFGRAVG